MKTKLKSILAVALCAVGFAAFAAESVRYLDWDEGEKALISKETTDYEVYTGQTTLDEGKTYVVLGNVTNTTRITVEGTVANPTRLILCDGAKLVAEAGVKVTVSGATTNALVICGQVNGTGALEATGGQRTAGIGGLSNDTEGESGMGGTVTINGGTVTAKGGDCAAGIGGGWGGHGGTVTINGGTVTAMGVHYGAGIGGGLYGAGGNVSINGGTVTATAGTDGGEAPTVAIGCCQESGDNGTVTFGAGFNVVTGETAAVTAPIAQDDYAADHSATYVHIEPALVAQFVKGGAVVAEFNTAAAAVAALDDEQYANIEEFRIGLAADTVFDFGGRTNRVVILNVGNVENTLKNVLLDGVDGGCAVTGSVGTVVFGDGVRIEKEALDFKRGMVKLIIKGGLYKNVPSGYCEEGYFGALRYDENEKLNGLYAVLPEAAIAVEDPKGIVSTRYATLQDAFNLIKENTDVTLRLFNNLELGKAVTKLKGNKFVHLLPSESGANTITRNGEEPVIEIGREAKLAISNVVFNGANVPSGNPMIEVVGKDKPTVEGKFGWLIACDGFVVSNAVGGAVHVGSGGRFELDGVAKIIDNTTDGKPKNVIIEDKQAIVLVNGGAVTDGNYAQIGVYSDNDKFMIPGGQFGAVDKKYKFAESFADGDILVEKPWVGFINDLDGTLHHAAGAKIADAPKAGEGKKTYKRWVGGEYKVTLEEGDYLVSRVAMFPMAPDPNCFPELIWTARQDAPAAQPAPVVLDWTDTTLTLAVSNGCDYALVKDGSAETNWVSVVGTNACEFARPEGTDYLCLRRYSITPSNIVSAATAYSVRVAAGTEDDPWTVGAENPKDVTAWTNGNEFVVGGTGTVSHLSKLASKVTAQKLTIKDATVTVAASDAFAGIGTEAVPVELTLPDGWQGELPGEGGNWYGATVNMDNFVVPLAVKNVAFQQRYPWNGKVDIGFGVTGPVGETNVVVTAYTNGTVKIASYVAAVTIPASGVLATNLVWDAEEAGLAANFKSDDVTVEVKIDESDIAAKSAAGALDLTVGDRVAKDVETLVVDPAWDETDPSLAKVFIDGEEEPRQYTVATNDTWETAELEPGRYELEMQTSCSSYPAIFWKTGDDWVVFNSSNVTEGATFEADKTYLMLGTNTVAGTLKVTDGAKFEYGEGAGFLGGTVAELPKRYEQKDLEGGLYQIVEKIKGCADNPWVVGEGVEAWTNGTELVVQGAGSVTNLADVVTDWGDIKGGLTAINVTSNGVTGAVSDAFQGVGGGNIALKLPDGWQGELPGEGGNWYGATVDMDNFVYPLTVKNVTFQQRYPWNGKVDIGFGVTGPVGETNVIITVRDGESEVTNFTAAVTIPVGGVFAANLVWDADAAGLGVDFKSDDVTVEVKIAEPDIAAKSEVGTVDLRTNMPLDERAVTVAGVGYSDTAWGTEPEAKVTLGWTNETTGATGVIATGLEREGAVKVDLPKQNGAYKLTHSTGGLTSIVKFTVKGYPLGCETNPWKVGPGEDPERTVAWTDGNSNVYFKPPSSTVTRTGLETITNALDGADFPAKLVSEDGTATNNIVMVLGASGTAYGTLAEALAANEASYTLFEVGGYFVSYSGGEGASGTMATDKFIPTVPTNLTANAYKIIGYRFDGWTTNGTTVAYTNRHEGVDFVLPGETLALTALWTQVGVEPADYADLTNAIEQATRPVTITLDEDVTLQPGDKVVIPEGKDVSFVGTGKFDVSGIVPQFGEPVTVGEGLAEGDLDRFKTDKDVKAYYEDGKVVLRGRGETEDFPWLLGTDGHEDEVTAWKIDGGILAKPARGAVSVAALQSVTNALSGFVPGPGQLKVISADGTATNNVVMLLGSDGVVYDTLEEVLSADPLPETVRLFEVGSYFVSYSGGEGALGTMATDTFVPTVPTNLTANAYEIIGYRFDGWTTNGMTVAYTNRQEGVDFAQPGETLALTALWTQVGVEPADYADLTNLIAQATLPVTITLDEDIALQPGDKVVIPAGKDVTFVGTGKFDVSGIVPQFGEPVVVGEGFAEGDLDRFDADGVSKPVFEDGAVGLVARGESADFPWVLDEESGVAAWVDEALTNLAGVVIEDGLPTATNSIDLVALTNNFATYGYEPALRPLNALLAVGKDGGAPEYVKPVNWIGEQGEYATLEAALAAGETAVVPNFETKETEIPQEIVETGKGADGKTYTAVVENKPAEDVEEPVKATYAEGLVDIATTLNTNVTLKVVANNAASVAPGDAASLSNALKTVSFGGKGFASVAFADISVFFNGEKQTNCEFGSPITLHIPWPVVAGGDYGVVRIHDGVAQTIPQGEGNAVDGEFFTVDVAAGEIVLRVNKFSDYAVGSTPAVEVTLPAALPGVTYVVSNLTTGAEISADSTTAGGATYLLPIGAKVSVTAVAKDGYSLKPGAAAAVVDSVPADAAAAQALIDQALATWEVVPCDLLLYPDGDGAFKPAKKTTTYYGALIGEDGVAGTITLKMTKPNRKTGQFNLSATVKTLVDKQSYSFRALKVTEADAVANADGVLTFALEGSNKKSKAHVLAVTLGGDSLTGAFDGFAIDGARHVFSTSRDPKREAVLPFVGTWTGAFAEPGDTNGVSVTAFSAKLTKLGSASVKVCFEDGKTASCSAKAEVGADGVIAVPATVWRSVKGGYRSFGFRLVFGTDADGKAVCEATDLSPVRDWVRKTGETIVVEELEFLAAGRQTVTAKDFKSYVVAVDPALAEALGPVEKNTLKLSASTGRITGTLKWSVQYEDKCGCTRTKTVSGKATGIVVNGVGIGTVTVKLDGVTSAFAIEIQPSMEM